MRTGETHYPAEHPLDRDDSAQAHSLTHDRVAEHVPPISRTCATPRSRQCQHRSLGHRQTHIMVLDFPRNNSLNRHNPAFPQYQGQLTLWPDITDVSLKIYVCISNSHNSPILFQFSELEPEFRPNLEHFREMPRIRTSGKLGAYASMHVMLSTGRLCALYRQLSFAFPGGKTVTTLP